MLDSIADWFRWLHQAHGINLTIFYDPIDARKFAFGIWTTIELSLASVVASTIIGIAGAWLQQSHLVWTRRGVQMYIQLFRNTPPLVQLYFFYFALDGVLAHATGGTNLLGSFGWSMVSLSFFAGAYNVEIFRAGIEAVPRSTVEAAESLGYTRFGVYRHVVLPLAFRISLPALNNNLVNLVKTTTIAYAIATPETLYMANQIWSDSVNVPEMMNVVYVVYIVLVGALVWTMGKWERAMRLPGIDRGTA